MSYMSFLVIFHIIFIFKTETVFYSKTKSLPITVLGISLYLHILVIHE